MSSFHLTISYLITFSFPCDLDKRSMCGPVCSLIQGFLYFHKHILHKCRGYSHNETLLDESNILACAWLAVEDCGLQRAAGRNTMLDLCLLFFSSYSFSPK